MKNAKVLLALLIVIAAACSKDGQVKEKQNTGPQPLSGAQMNLLTPGFPVQAMPMLITNLALKLISKSSKPSKKPVHLNGTMPTTIFYGVPA